MSEALAEGPADRSDRELHELVTIHGDRRGSGSGSGLGRGLCLGRGAYTDQGFRLDDAPTDRGGSALARQGPNQFLLPGVFAQSELLRSLGSAEIGLVGLHRGLGGSDGFAQFS